LKLDSTSDVDVLIAQSHTFGVLERQELLGADYIGLQELVLYGLKGEPVSFFFSSDFQSFRLKRLGLSAYADHCVNMGTTDPKVIAFVYEALAFLTRSDATVPELLAMALKVGEVNLGVMGTLEELHISKFGNPTPKKVRATGVQGKAILISGHDLSDLDELLKQTEGTGVNVYTHGEMLPAHGYPQFQKYDHFKGNFGI
jgi:hydroxylamine reductase